MDLDSCLQGTGTQVLMLFHKGLETSAFITMRVITIIIITSTTIIISACIYWIPWMRLFLLSLPLSYFLNCIQHLYQAITAMLQKSLGEAGWHQRMGLCEALHLPSHLVCPLVPHSHPGQRPKWPYLCQSNKNSTYRFLTSVMPRNAFLGMPWIWFSLRSLKQEEKS